MNLINLSTICSFLTLYPHFAQSQTKQYVATPTTFTRWVDAAEYCANNGHILATFDTITDITTIYNLCSAFSEGGSCWLGFRDADNEMGLRFIDDGELVDDEASCCWKAGEPNAFGDSSTSCGDIETSNPISDSLLDSDCGASAPGAPSQFGICEIIPDEIISTTSVNVGMEDDSHSDSESSSESDSNENAAKLNREISLEHENEDDDEDGNGYNMSMTIGFSKATWFDLWVIFGIFMVFNFVACMGLMKRKKETGCTDHDDRLPNSV